jgi:alpha-D-xyloside xylohydrolase
MKKIVTLLLLLIPFFFFSCGSKGYKKLEDGVLVFVKDTSGIQTVKVQVVNEWIIHIQSDPGKTIRAHESLMIADHPAVQTKWDLEESDTSITIATARLRVRILKKTGELAFLNNDGSDLLIEKSGGGKYFSALELEGKSYFTIRQIFESPDDEAFYGLGQHQHDLMNYKGKDVDLYQHNIVSVVPFLVSNRNYGILWDNYSHSKFGDPRDYEDISSLQLFTKSDEAGGLTALYTSRNDDKKIFLERKEDVIDYQYLNDLPKIPKEFPMAEGKVIWEGSFEPNVSGIHKFSMYSAGYLKFWFNGQLILDCWRQGWNPWSRLLDLEMEAGRKYPVRIEWIPDAGESFIALKYKSPIDPEEQNKLSLWSEVADGIDYYFIAGNNLDQVISGYRTLTGKSPVMPKWAMGFWQSRERYRTQDELLGVVKEFRKRHIPFDNIVLDWFYWPEDKWGDHDFDSTRFPDPKGMIDELHDSLNAQIMISVWPKLYTGTENYKYMNERGWVYTKNVENQQKDWVGYVSTFYDVFNPEARAYFWGKMNEKLYSKGIDAWWMDATEPDILSNTSIETRKKLMEPCYLGPSAEYYNAYSLMNSKAVYEGQRSVNPDRRVFILTRSAYAGQQRFASATWSGDVASRWYDLKAQIPAGLNFSLSGIPYWTTDIGGFSLERRYENPQGQDLDEWRELNTRWYQFGAFCPLFRVHGQYPLREIFNMAPESHPAYKSMLYYDKLRYRLMPYIYTLAGNTYRVDYTIMRALVMDFPEDKNVIQIGDQFMFGPSIMVCPVYEYKERNREVYLPAGQGWYDFYSGKYYEGGQTIIAEAPYERIPLFIKSGSILPFGPDIEYALQGNNDALIIWVYQGNDAEFDIYEDENINYTYENGDFGLLPLYYSEGEKQLKIGKQQGIYTGMPETRNISVVFVSEDKPIGFTLGAYPLEKVDYKGQELTISVK